MALDFRSAAELFLSSEQELALALGVPLADLREYRQNPGRAPEALLARLGQVLIERGKAMTRVGELLAGE